MSACPSCSQETPLGANFCSQCGQILVKNSSEPEAEPTQSESTPTSLQLWETFIGPSKSLQFSLKTWWTWRPAFLYYKEKFSNLETPAGPRFALSWNWPAALFDSFLWFLYRKMYLFALLYAVGPFLALYLTGIPTVGVVWKIMAAVSANYLYFWHVKDHLQKLKTQGLVEQTSQEEFLKEEGGVQQYVIWLGALLMLFGVLFSDQYMEMYRDEVPMEQSEQSSPDSRTHMEESGP